MQPSNISSPDSQPFNRRELSSYNYPEAEPQKYASIEYLSQQAVDEAAYGKPAVNSIDTVQAGHRDVDASRLHAYGQFEAEQAPRLTIAEMTNNLAAVRIAALTNDKDKSNPSPVARPQHNYDLAA